MTTSVLDGMLHFRLHLGPGADLFQGLRDFLDDQRLSRAFVLSTIGSLRRVVINFPKSMDEDPEVGSVALDGPFEINGISGEVWRDGAGIRVHLHGSVTREASHVYGGGLGDGAVVLKLADMVVVGIR